MESNKIENINLQILGEIGKYNTLPIEYLVEISKKLQTLLQTIAKVSITDTSTIDLNNFKIELSGFFAGSAVPQFSFTNRVQTTISDVSLQREVVKGKFEQLLKITNEGEYDEIKSIYPDGYRRNAIVEDLYEFTTSFGNSPVNVVNVLKDGNSTKIIPLYPVKKFNKEAKERLKVNMIENKELEIHEDISFRKVKTTVKNGHKNTKTLEEYSNKRASLSYSPDVIVCENTTYELSCPLRCLLEKEDEYFVITCELLDIVGTGLTIDDAEESFGQEFDYIYKRYNQLSNDNLIKRLQAIKTIINIIVKP